MKLVRLKRLIIAIWFVVNAPILSADELQDVNKEHEMYKMGNEAYQKKDYVSALKYLFAYRVANREELAKHDKFSTQIDEAIAISEKQIRDAIKFREKYTKSEESFRRRFEGAAF